MTTIYARNASDTEGTEDPNDTDAFRAAHVTETPATETVVDETATTETTTTTVEDGKDGQ